VALDDRQRAQIAAIDIGERLRVRRMDQRAA